MKQVTVAMNPEILQEKGPSQTVNEYSSLPVMLGIDQLHLPKSKSSMGEKKPLKQGWI